MRASRKRSAGLHRRRAQRQGDAGDLTRARWILGLWSSQCDIVVRVIWRRERGRPSCCQLSEQAPLFCLWPPRSRATVPPSLHHHTVCRLKALARNPAPRHQTPCRWRPAASVPPSNTHHLAYLTGRARRRRSASPCGCARFLTARAASGPLPGTPRRFLPVIKTRRVAGARRGAARRVSWRACRRLLVAAATRRHLSRPPPAGPVAAGRSEPRQAAVGSSAAGSRDEHSGAHGGQPRQGRRTRRGTPRGHGCRHQAAAARAHGPDGQQRRRRVCLPGGRLAVRLGGHHQREPQTGAGAGGQWLGAVPLLGLGGAAGFAYRQKLAAGCSSTQAKAGQWRGAAAAHRGPCAAGCWQAVPARQSSSPCLPPACLQGADATAYEGCTYRLSLRFTSEYPFKAPAVRFETPCFHPNVDTYGNICLDILKDKWSGERVADSSRRLGRQGAGSAMRLLNATACACLPGPSPWPHLDRAPWRALPSPRRLLPAAAYSVKTILQSIQSLLADPNVDSPLNAHAAKLWGANDAGGGRGCCIQGAPRGSPACEAGSGCLPDSAQAD